MSQPVEKKTWSYLILSAFSIAALALSACAKKDDGGGSAPGGGGTVATTPCSGSSCYTQNGNGNFVIPPSYTNSGSYCGCQTGQRPVYNPAWGYACAPANQFTYNYYLGYNYQSLYNQSSPQYQSQNTIPLNMQQISYAPLSYGGSNCFNDVAASCDTRVANACTQGGVCRPVGGGSSIGVCTRGEGIDNYNNQNPYNQNPYYNPYNNPYNQPYNNSNCIYRQTSWGGIVYTCGM